MKSIISEEDVEKAVDWLRDNVDASAKARATRIYLEEYRKSLKALLMSKYQDLSVSAQEREAYAHQDYRDHLKVMQNAIYEDERMKFFRASAEVKIEAWRTQQANIRAIKL
jgi:hypothetical protein